jgi:hypothetical protein
MRLALPRDLAGLLPTEVQDIYLLVHTLQGSNFEPLYTQ